MNANEIFRLILNLIRKGTVIAVDHDNEKCRVGCGELETNWVRWLSLAAGDTSDWNPPTVGEQVLVLSAGGDMADGVVLRGIYSNDYPAPSHARSAHTRVYPDGARIEYEFSTQTLTMDLPKLAQVLIKAASLVSLETGMLKSSGCIQSGGNLIAGTGATGVFTSSTGQVITVSDGIVINIE